MSKRSSFPRKERDFYETIDPKSIPPNFLKFIRGKKYYEPSCGSGELINLLRGHADCVGCSDIEPLGIGDKKDALCLSKEDIARCDLIITNPIYTKSVLLPLVNHFVSLKPTWLLLPAGLMHNKYFAPYMKGCSKVISIGRLCWFPKDGKRVASTENYSWYFWPKGSLGSGDNIETVFYTRGDS